MSKARLQPLLQDRSEELLEGGPTSSNKEPGDRKYIVAVIQNRAKEVRKGACMHSRAVIPCKVGCPLTVASCLASMQVGLAALDLSNARTLWLGQYVEATRSFTNTL